MDGSGADTELRVGLGSGWTILADRPPAGDIKRELWPNLCRRACSTVSLHRIGHRARMPETPVNCVPITSRRIWIATDPVANADFAAERLLRLTEGRKRTDGSLNIGYK